MRKVGLEPTRPEGHRPLRPARLPNFATHAQPTIVGGCLLLLVSQKGKPWSALDLNQAPPSYQLDALTK